jgi:CubicO group peptidase (beta-lactamase class C family)
MVAIVLSFLVVGSCAGPEGEPPNVALVENGLLPATIIEGEPGFALADRMNLHKVPGVGIAVIEDAEIRWVRHYGVMNLDQRTVVDESTVFNVGSVSKSVTAAVILSLAEEGLIDLDAPVNDQLRSWRVPENEFTREAAVTPLRLMNHSGGVVFSPPYSYPAEDLPTLDQILDGLPPARSAPVHVDCVPGTRFQYSNAGFTVLRKLVEDVTGRSFEDVARERVFEPIGMSNSSFRAPLADADLQNAAMGHSGDGSPDADHRRWLAHTAAGGLWTTAAEYAAFVVELQRALRGEPGRILSRDSVELMVRPHDAPQYGLGVFQRGGGERARWVSHLGDGPGFVAGFSMDVIGGRGLVVVTNGYGGISLVREIGRAVATVEAWPDYLPAAQVPITPDPQLLEAAAGRYRMGVDEEVVLELREGALWLETFEIPAVKLFAVGDGTFVCRERSGEITVKEDPGGGVQVVYRLSDELGRLGGKPEELQRLAPGERTALGLLLDGATAEATEMLQTLMASDPESPAVAEGRLNSLGYRFLATDRPRHALAVFELNAELYPTSANAHDSLGEALMKNGRIEESIASYRRSLELDPGNRNAEEKIAKMSQ